MNDKPGRNSTCPCGSGKKFKKCCGLDLTPASDSYATCYQIEETRKEEPI